tara:strand:+ start:141 stop:410 length:270 start_codon:yes stop_codon:yes gene_type:complete
MANITPEERAEQVVDAACNTADIKKYDFIIKELLDCLVQAFMREEEQSEAYRVKCLALDNVNNAIEYQKKTIKSLRLELEANENVQSHN